MDYNVHEDNPLKLFNRIMKRDDKLYINLLLAGFCMPTLLRQKPASLIQISKIYGSWNNLLELLWEETTQYECKLEVLYENSSMASILIYQEELLHSNMIQPENYRYFKENGYQGIEDNNRLLKAVSNRLTGYNKNIINQCSVRAETLDERLELLGFPHEIGVVLGYPLEDVKGYIINKGKNYLLNGYWKVYHNKEQAERIFENYKKIQSSALESVGQGKIFESI